MLWGWHHPYGCKFGRGLGRREVGGCFGLAPPLRVQERQAAARIRQTRVSVWAIPGGKMGGVAPEDGRDRKAKPPMLQRAFLRPLRSVPRGVCGIAAGRPSDGRSEAAGRQTGFAPPNSVFFLFPHTCERPHPWKNHTKGRRLSFPLTPNKNSIRDEKPRKGAVFLPGSLACAYACAREMWYNCSY